MNKELKIKIIFWVCAIIILALLIIISLIYEERMEKADNNSQETAGVLKTTAVLTYQYNFTKCVFKSGGIHVVCNLLMEESCKDIKKTYGNCEVLDIGKKKK